ncbi:hypothetical protein KC340_g169 [Hortaea werneckii]|nr:hypothetical protein KC342_g15350 [Hortaea werneckii]KAI7109760.1 hypothetical protein KC339_g571 [Hortaea werneckii]KAI7202958.1 hypothetical protein KC365_g18361 [Hortaea werneckii]KAI7340659.1 hypothetical protein KC340_g169 [Hortaea werneckii]KAI7383671.1 hypothetical protein KC328_g11164 [Hortaea werneckii]
MSNKEATSSSPTKPAPTTNTKSNRLPAPSLFVGPPSHNASQLSVSRTGGGEGKTARDPLMRTKSKLGETTTHDHSKDANTTGTTAFPTLRKASEKSVDRKWREMQNTLNEVELTAQSSTHVFGTSHAAALDDLRKAQVELAKAWGRGNEDKATQAAEKSVQSGGEHLNRFEGSQSIASDRISRARARGGTDASASTTLSDESSATAGTAKSGISQMEEETAQDIRLASERRAANEAYFKKVDESVKDVVSRLEVVAEAMRGVEGESRSLWSGSSTTSDTTETDGDTRSRAQTAVEG